MVNFNPYYDLSPALLGVVASSINPLFQLLNLQKGCITVSVRRILLTEPILCDTPSLS